MSYKFAVIGTDQTGGMPGPDDGKGGMAVTTQGPFAKGYKIVRGEWNPHGIGVVTFDTESSADQWIAGDDGKAWVRKYENVILARLKA